MESKNSILKLPVSAISLIFSQISAMDCKVSWIRTPDYGQQLYVSPSYEKIWGIDPYKLYEHPLSWNETVVNKEVITTLKNREPHQTASIYFQILDANKKIKFIKDTCFHLFDSSGKLVAVAGIAEEITERQWSNEGKILRPDNTDPIQNILNKIVSKSNATLATERPYQQLANADGKLVNLTPREQACLMHLAKGNTAKKIARILLISPRTVEVHIENIKLKLSCHSRLELISQLNKHWIEH